MRVARLGAALVLAGGALLASAPAAAADTPSGAWTNPVPVGTATDDIPVAYLETPHPLEGYAQSPNGVAGVAFTLVKDAADRPDDPCSAATQVKPQSAPGGSGRVAFAFAAPFPCNRRYQVRATVAPAQRPLRQDTPLVLNLWVAVAIPAAPTTGLSAVLGDDRVVSLRWDAASHEPDFQGYEVRRSTGGEFVRIGEVGPTALSYVDPAVPPTGGQLRYQVVGLRPGPDAGTTVFADGGAPAEIDVAPAQGASSSGDSNGTGGSTSAIRPAGSGRVQSVHRVFRAPSRVVRSTTPTTADTGFQETLPFGQPAGDPAVVARLGDDEGDSGQRQTLLLVAGGTTAFSWAMALRLLTRRAVGL